MSALFWVLGIGVAGLLTGKIIGEDGYGKALSANATAGLDVLLGIVGGLIGGYLFYWAVIGEENSFNRYGTAVLGSITFVSVARAMSTRWRHLPSNLR
jgi:uncharacterized membrane protein YeaQ/YmgE (transglycosylase-associated protein family)